MEHFLERVRHRPSVSWKYKGASWWDFQGSEPVPLSRVWRAEPAVGNRQRWYSWLCLLWRNPKTLGLRGKLQSFHLFSFAETNLILMWPFQCWKAGPLHGLRVAHCASVLEGKTNIFWLHVHGGLIFNRKGRLKQKTSCKESPFLLYC